MKDTREQKEDVGRAVDPESAAELAIARQRLADVTKLLEIAASQGISKVTVFSGRLETAREYKALLQRQEIGVSIKRSTIDADRHDVVAYIG
jgi:hypothetical protein